MEPTKACPVVLRGPKEAREILVFRHPLAGIQLVKGSIEPEEPADAAAVRELREGAGVAAVACAPLGVWNVGYEAQVWAFQLCEPVEPLSERWTHVCADDGGHTFSFFWQPLDATSLDDWHPVHARALAHIRILLKQDEDTTRLPMKELMAQVGYLLLYWGFLEAAQREKKGVLHLPGSAVEFERVRGIRNLVAHGIVSADAREAEAFIQCADEKGNERRLTLPELADAAQTIDRIRRELLVGRLLPEP